MSKEYVAGGQTWCWLVVGQECFSYRERCILYFNWWHQRLSEWMKTVHCEWSPSLYLPRLCQRQIWTWSCMCVRPSTLSRCLVSTPAPSASPCCCRSSSSCPPTSQPALSSKSGEKTKYYRISYKLIKWLSHTTVVWCMTFFAMQHI